MRKYRYTKIVLLPFALVICGLLQADVIQVNNKTFQTPDLSGFAHISDRKGIIEAFPLVDQDYRHITHFVIYEESDSENPVIGRFTTPTRSVGARIKPRKEFISEILSFKYDEDAAEKLRASFKEAQNILEKGEQDISVYEINSGLLTPIIVDHDEYGFYSAQLVKGIKEGVEFQQATISASTVIDNTFFILYVSKEFEGLQTHQELLETSKEFIAEFVQLNEK
jgi:hypothetical protein